MFFSYWSLKSGDATRRRRRRRWLVSLAHFDVCCVVVVVVIWRRRLIRTFSSNDAVFAARNTLNPLTLDLTDESIYQE